MLKAQQPFECNGDFILSLTNDFTGSNFYFVKPNQGSDNVTFVPFSSGSGDEINATGYRITDNLVYGIDALPPHELYQVDRNGEVVGLTFLDNLKTEPYFAGDITPDGDFLVLFGASGSTLSIVDLTSDNYQISNQTLTSTSGLSVLCGDIAFDPTSGDLFGFDERSRRLVKIDLDNNTVDNEIFPPTEVAFEIGALFFDSFGRLWGYGNEDAGEIANTLFLINTKTGAVVRKTTGRSSPGQDGCNCPYSVKMQKKVSAAVAFSCTSIDYTFTIANFTTEIQRGIIFEDQLPVGFEITEVSTHSFGGQVSGGIGSNFIKIENMTLALGLDSITIRVAISETVLAGTIKNQARLYNLPELYGTEVISDDPTTLFVGDSTNLEIRALDIDSSLLNYTLCPDDTLLLKAATGANYGINYQWNDGSTANSLLATNSGNYQVTITTDCETTISTIKVIDGQQELVIGSSKSVILGDSIKLEPAVYGYSSPAFNWTANPSESFLCVSSPSPYVRPANDTQYTLTVSEEGGCELSDQLTVEVIKKRGTYVPNAFSPNGDGINDHFSIYSESYAKIKVFQVFNRWGAVVFSEKDKDSNTVHGGWDGYFNNEIVENGVYMWYAELEFLDKEMKMISGTVTVLK